MSTDTLNRSATIDEVDTEITPRCQIVIRRYHKLLWWRQIGKKIHECSNPATWAVTSPCCGRPTLACETCHAESTPTFYCRPCEKFCKPRWTRI